MREVLERDYPNRWLYIFTTEGNVYAGLYKGVVDTVVEVLAPDGVTLLQIALSDISGIRAFEDQPAVVPPPEEDDEDDEDDEE